MNIEVEGHEVVLDEDYLNGSLEEVRGQLNQYLRGERETFSIDIDLPDGFTGRVLEEILKIPYGSTRTYTEIAESLDSSAIAVGQACGRNSMPLIVPCHRVVGVNGLGGYMYGKKLKQFLIKLESGSLDTR